jgi:hypothetical protein
LTDGVIVDLGVVSDGVFSTFPGCEFIDPGDYPYAQPMVSLAPGAHTLGVRISWTSTVLAFDAVLPAAFKGFLVVTGSIGGTGGDDMRLLLVNASVPPWTVEFIPLHVPGGARAGSSPAGVMW